MSNLTPEAVCNSYKWLLHLGGPTICNTTVYNAVGSALPVTFLNGDVMTVTNFALSNIQSTTPYKGVVFGSISATNLLTPLTANPYAGKICTIDSNTSVISTPASQFVHNICVGSQNNLLLINGLTYGACCSVNNLTIQHCNGVSTDVNNRNTLLRNKQEAAKVNVINSVALASNTTNSFARDTVNGNLSSSSEGYNVYRSFRSCTAVFNNTCDSFGAAGTERRSAAIVSVSPSDGLILNSSYTRNTNCQHLSSSYGSNTGTNAFTYGCNSTLIGCVDGQITNSFALNRTGNSTTRLRNTLALEPGNIGTCTIYTNSLLLGGGQCLSSWNTAAMNVSTWSGRLTSMNGSSYYGSIANLGFTDTATAIAGCICLCDAVQGPFTFGSGFTFGTNSFTFGSFIIDTCQRIFQNVRNASILGGSNCCNVILSGSNNSISPAWSVTNCGRNSFASGLFGNVFVNACNSAVFGTTNALSANTTYFYGSQFQITSLPTSPTGLPCGHVWRDPATFNLRIVLS